MATTGDPRVFPSENPTRPQERRWEHHGWRWSCPSGPHQINGTWRRAHANEVSIDAAAADTYLLTWPLPPMETVRCHKYFHPRCVVEIPLVCLNAIDHPPPHVPPPPLLCKIASPGFLFLYQMSTSDKSKTFRRGWAIFYFAGQKFPRLNMDDLAAEAFWLIQCEIHENSHPTSQKVLVTSLAPREGKRAVILLSNMNLFLIRRPA